MARDMLRLLMGTILAVVVVISTFGFMTSMLGWFTETADQGTRATFNEIAESIDLLFHEDNTKITECFIQNKYIGPDFAFVGFRKVDSKNNEKFADATSNEWCGVDEVIERPGSCGHGACICLCNGGWGDVTGDDCKEQSATCVPLSSKISYLAGRDEFMKEYKFLVLYGKTCSSYDTDGWGKDKGLIKGFKIIKDNPEPSQVGVYEVCDKCMHREIYQPLCKDLKTLIKPKAKPKTEVKKEVKTEEKTELVERTDKQVARIQ